jgi:predicted HTH transcriptional regulator
VILRATRQIIKPALALDPSEPEIYEIDGKQLVVATVPPNNGSIYQSGGVCWVRRSTHTVPLSVSELIEMANDRALVRWELLPARNAVMEDIDFEKIEVYLRRRSMGSRQAGRFENMEQVLIGMEYGGTKSQDNCKGFAFCDYTSHPLLCTNQSEQRMFLCITLY